MAGDRRGRHRCRGRRRQALPSGGRAFHLQQAAEKLIKALLVLAGEPFRRTRDLDDLASRVVPIYPRFAQRAEAVRHLSVWV
jgi:HEPN domain-containing protein